MNTKKSIHTSPRPCVQRAGPVALIACASVMSLGFAQAIAQSWSPDTLEIAAGSATGVACDSAGSVYVSGQLSGAIGAILKSNDRGETWQTSYVAPSGTLLAFSAISVGNVPIETGGTLECVYALGWSKVPTSWGWVRGWEVYRSVDAGGTWEPITDGPFVSGDYSQQPEAIAVDSEGHLYIAGYSEERVQTSTRKNSVVTTHRHWIVRKGTRVITDVGDDYQWATVENLRGDANLTNWAFGITCVGRDVFAAGTVNNVWQVRKSSNGGVTWIPIDHFQLELGQTSQAFAITADGHGNLVCGGRGTRSISKRLTETTWVVRRGTTQGGFQTIDANTGSMARSVAIDAFGALQVTGYFGSGISWFTREGRMAANGMWTWSSTDQIGSNSSHSVNGIAADAFGNVYAVGYSQDLSGSLSWLVRRRLADAP